MSFEAMKWVSDQDIRPSGRKYVLLALANYADTEGWCFPGQRTIAHYCSQDERTVRAHLAALEADGLVKRERRYTENGRQQRDGFVLRAPSDLLRPRARARAERISAPRAERISASRAGNSSGKGGEIFRLGRKISPPHIDEPKENPNLTQSGGALSAPTPEANEAYLYWRSLQDAFRKAFSDIELQVWLAKLSPLKLTSDEIIVAVGSRFLAEHITKEFGWRIAAIAGRRLTVLGPDDDLRSVEALPATAGGDT
jgi:hypothetical protein